MADSTADIPLLKLNDGHSMPILGLGLAVGSKSFDPDVIVQAVMDAISIGYRHFDTAWFYKTERVLGQACRKAISDGIVTRDQLFITSKIWMFNLKRDYLIAQAKESNDNLGLGYIDLLLIHGPIPFKKLPDLNPTPFNDDGTPVMHHDLDIHTESWSAMEHVRELGICRSIGVSNYNTKQLEKTIAHCKVMPAVNEVESNPFLKQDQLLSLCRQHGIVMTAYSPFGGQDRKPTFGQTNDYNRNQDANKKVLWEHEVINKIAVKHKKTVPQILLKFHVGRGVAVVPKSVSKGRMRENLSIFDFELDDEDWKSLQSLDDDRPCMPAALVKWFNLVP